MKMKLIHIILFLLLLLPTLTFAQDGYTYMGLTYSMAVPMSGTEDYINAGSYRGMNFEGYRELKPKFAVGWLFGWNVFHTELRNETYVKDNLTITGNQFRYQNEFPMLARGLYLFGVPAGIRPFIGAGVGVIYNIRRTDIGLYSLKTDAWHFSVAPEIGINIPVGESQITAGVRYNYGVKAGDLGEQSYISFNLGFMFVP
jgi:hypothetical protein